ncbi:DNA starvation/stationary phase protection protein [Brevibacillus laterosporus]|uniref:DNA starvation/stationary phase protection protein n=1 Tax=Brevibacillus laterosporus TaxID=1465 RepID=A0A518V5P2_BRELA|nr:Dps family protein [Brevibacillus laterosporus]QDX92295.1 DNA starvation/stationary phase protection protein [Brevibacillus laterosporus]RAP25845.1 Non-specific DNA-binding protein Dps [Brevibacillus laterosporus]TPG70604.1 DNA starvation/stationary phase protection protein [Brevibacillus laterosporus]
MAQQVMVSNQKVIDVLNRQVANWNVLFVKLHNYHWYVKGPHFFTLHEKFEELFNEATTRIDDLGERVLAIGGKPAATLTEYATLSTIQESSCKESAEEMVQAIIVDFQTLSNECQKGMEVAQEAGDESTSDMLLGTLTDLQKHIWMLNSYLGK